LDGERRSRVADAEQSIEVLERARLLMDVERWVEAERIIFAEGGPALGARASVMLALCALGRRDNDQARALVNGALGQAPDDPYVRGGAASVFFAAGRPAEAILHAAWCVEQDPFDIEALETLALCRLWLGDKVGGRQTAVALVSVDPTHPASCNVMAAMHHLAGEWAEAEHWTRSGLAAAPDSEMLQTRLARILHKRGLDTEAVELMTALVARDPRATESKELLYDVVESHLYRGVPWMLLAIGSPLVFYARFTNQDFWYIPGGVLVIAGAGLASRRKSQLPALARDVHAQVKKDNFENNVLHRDIGGGWKGPVLVSIGAFVVIALIFAVLIFLDQRGR